MHCVVDDFNIVKYTVNANFLKQSRNKIKRDWEITSSIIIAKQVNNQQRLNLTESALIGITRSGEYENLDH